MEGKIDNSTTDPELSVDPKPDLEQIKKDIDDGKLVAVPPKTKDQKRHKSKVFEVLHVIYQKDDTIIPSVFQCSKCKVVLYCKRSLGTGPLARHLCVKQHMAAEAAKLPANETSGKVMVDLATLASLLSAVSVIGHENGPMKSEDVQKILPTTSSNINW